MCHNVDSLLIDNAVRDTALRVRLIGARKALDTSTLKNKKDA